VTVSSSTANRFNTVIMLPLALGLIAILMCAFPSIPVHSGGEAEVGWNHKRSPRTNAIRLIDGQGVAQRTSHKSQFSFR
jgi:hypothetical protein